jgi:putative phosphoserine phosphatase/1-acylglycerol-3-phosphate O-acyltransferase
MTYVAFFDLDHTILKINSGEALLRRAYKNGQLSTWKLIHAYYLAISHKLKLIDSSAIIKTLGTWLAKASVDDIEKLCNEIAEKDLIPAIRPEIINEIRMHRDKGANLVILSSALTTICSPVAKHLEMHSVICSELEVLNFRYTGQSIGKFCLKDEKLHRMNQYLLSNNYSSKDCYYYGDSIDDLPVLSSVGYPVCVNPDSRLKKIALERNWSIQS